MDRNEMERLWSGKVINAHKINRFKADKSTVFSCTMKIYQKVLVDEITESGYYKNEKLARFDLENRLRKQKEEKYPWSDLAHRDLQWTFTYK